MQRLLTVLGAAIDDARLAEVYFEDAAWRRELTADPDAALRRFALAGRDERQPVRLDGGRRTVRILATRRSPA